jgi:hypothetical protein
LSFFVAASFFFTGRIQSLHFGRLIPVCFVGEAIRSVTHQAPARL